MSSPRSIARRPVISGLGFITPIGNDRPTVAANLRAGHHGLEPAVFYDNPALPVKVAGTVKGFDVASTNCREWTWPERYTIPRETLRGLPPHGVYALCAVDQALEDAGLKQTDVARDARTGLFCASAGSAMMLHHNLSRLDTAQGARGNPLGVVSSISGTLNFNLATHFAITGAVCGFVSACASSSHALGYACDEIRLGRLDRVIVVGAEEINTETLIPFVAMRALSPNDDPRRASRPFDARRNGFVGAGGAVALVLEAEEIVVARGIARQRAIMAGWGQAADGHSVALSHPEGAGIKLAMERALADAGVKPDDVDFVHAHATSTPVGDRAEALALAALFPPHSSRPIISSTKGLTGHPLSLSGAMETGFCALAIEEGFFPGNAHLEEPDECCAGLNLPRETVTTRPRCLLKNSSGFGGSNVSLVLAPR